MIQSLQGKASKRSFKALLPLCLLFFICLGMTSCSWKNRPILFKTKDKVDTNGLPVYRINPDPYAGGLSYEHKIQPDDRITVRFLNNFDISSGINFSSGAKNESETGFLVAANGSVRLPLVGAVHVQDCTRASAEKMLEARYTEHIKNPNIEISILNLSVSVMGEVSKPGVYPLTKERTNLIEVLAMANGITRYGKLKTVKVIRGDLDDPEVLIFDLTQIEALSAEELIVHDDDIIYIEPKGVKLVGDAVLPYTTLVSAITAIVLVVVTIQQRTR